MTTNNQWFTIQRETTTHQLSADGLLWRTHRDIDEPHGDRYTVEVESVIPTGNSVEDLQVGSLETTCIRQGAESGGLNLPTASLLEVHESAIQVYIQEREQRAKDQEVADAGGFDE